MNRYNIHPRQRGSTLFLTLIMLVVLTIISLATLGTSLMELRMSNNAEAVMAANENAQSTLDSVIHDDNNFLVSGSTSDSNCTSNLSGCTTTNVTVPTPLDTGSYVKITRLTDIACPARNPNEPWSCSTAKTALFNISSKYDRSGYGQGLAEINHGYAKNYAVSSGSTPDSSSTVTPASN